MTRLLDEISEAIIFEPLSLVDSIFEHRFYTFEDLLGDTPHILQILYLFPHGNTVAAIPAAIQKDENLVEEPDEECDTPYPTRDIKTYEFPDEFWNIPYPTSSRKKKSHLSGSNPSQFDKHHLIPSKPVQKAQRNSQCIGDLTHHDHQSSQRKHTIPK